VPCLLRHVGFKEAVTSKCVLEDCGDKAAVQFYIDLAKVRASGQACTHR